MTKSVEPKTTHNIAIRVFDAPAAQAAVFPGRLKILLLKLDHIGDFVTALEAFRVLRAAFAHAEITLICLPGVVALAESTRLFDKVKGFAAVPESNLLGKVSPPDHVEQVARFRVLLDGDYFLAADFQHDPYNRFGLDLVPTCYRAAFAADSQKNLDISLPTLEWDEPVTAVPGSKNLPLHAGLRLTLLAHAIVGSLKEQAADTAWGAAPDAVTAQPAYAALQTQKNLKIGLSVGAGGELRKWKPDYWIALLRHMAQMHNATFVFFGGAVDKAETQAIAAQLPPGSCIDLSGVLPLAAVPSYMKLLDAYIGCDTGLTHLAAQLGLRTVNIFAGISNISVWRARGPKVKTVYAEVICAPCHLLLKEDCPNNNVCMHVILPQIVYACFEQVLAL